MTRCPWANQSPLMVDYHDREWGVPVRNDQLLFEHLLLDSFQAGLSWAVILNKRENFRRAFDGFDPEKIARYSGARIKKLLTDQGIVRNRLKIEAAVSNARAYVELRESGPSFSDFIWQFVDGASRQNRWRSLRQIPARTAQSDAMSRELRARGFRFVGSTICYAFMQAAGLVNDHLVSCFRHLEVRGAPPIRRHHVRLLRHPD